MDAFIIRNEKKDEGKEKLISFSASTVNEC